MESSAIWLVSETKLSEAESDFKKAIEIRRQFLGGEPPNPLVVDTYIRLLRKLNKTDESDTFLKSFLIPSRAAPPQFLELADIYVDGLARKGQWTEAAAEVSAFVKVQPENYRQYHTLAPLLVAAHDVKAYRQLCQQIIFHFKGARAPLVADPMAKDCLILPSAGADLKVVGVLAEVAVTGTQNSGSYPLFQCCKALAEYRQGHFDEPTKWASSAVKYSFPYSKAEGYAILAMSQFGLLRTNEASAALANCDQVIRENFP